MKNLIIVPFHDWRKILLEGFRTRDAHFIEELKKRQEFSIKVVINRPTTLLEVFLKRKRNLIKGQVVFSKINFKLYKLEDNFYIIDYVSYDIFGQIIKGYKWFISQYGDAKYISFINDCINFLDMKNNYTFLNQNIFAYKLSESLTPKLSIFDAWDNFLKFNVYKNILTEIHIGYKAYSKCTDCWITNSRDNVIDFEEAYNPKHISLITNGVDVIRFVKKKRSVLPSDMIEIKSTNSRVWRKNNSTYRR
ncbi:hypothetical protein [Thalassobellus suaedae]|uniref:Uncharacterized protein n=1 Tax=Thalassobellus suaedae TaxID=3074124 RepID=A0ABY9XS68_9FLAO|nr:hypothetical protein RHP51_16105 [Flavobacteriaceae bacterium HL-DH14]